MKKLALLFVVMFLATTSFAEYHFYGQVRTGAWYEFQSEDYAGGDARTDFDYLLYGNSRLGCTVNWANNAVTAELSLSEWNVGLRHLFATMKMNDFIFTFGRTFTGFSDFSDMATSCTGSSDLSLVGYGMFYDGFNALFSIAKDKFYINIMEPNKRRPICEDPATAVAHNAVDALLPKINFGARCQRGNLLIHPSIGLSLVTYNEKDENIFSFAFATTAKYETEPFTILGQINFAQNGKNYGLAGPIPDAQYTNEIENVYTFGGYAQLTYFLSNRMDLIGGLGYTSSNADFLDDPDAAFATYAQLNLKMTDSFLIQPELGMINNLENGYGAKEGSVTYLGAKFQMNFDIN